jgi:GTP-binding protein
MIVVATKMDAAQDEERVEALRGVAREHGLEFFEISSVTGQGIEALKFAMAERVLAPVTEEATNEHE